MCRLGPCGREDGCLELRGDSEVSFTAPRKPQPFQHRLQTGLQPGRHGGCLACPALGPVWWQPSSGNSPAGMQPRGPRPPWDAHVLILHSAVQGTFAGEEGPPLPPPLGWPRWPLSFKLLQSRRVESASLLLPDVPKLVPASFLTGPSLLFILWHHTQVPPKQNPSQANTSRATWVSLDSDREGPSGGQSLPSLSVPVLMPSFSSIPWSASRSRIALCFYRGR